MEDQGRLDGENRQVQQTNNFGIYARFRDLTRKVSGMMEATTDITTAPGAVEEEPPFPLTETDKWVLSQTDEEFKLHDWEDLKIIIEHNKLETLKRKPSDLRRYITWSRDTKAQYGSMTNYLLQHRLPWGFPPFTYLSSVPFEDTSDYKILINDWPYGLTADITHIVVWSKTPVATDDDKGDMTDESRRVIEEFVQETFVKRLDGDKDRVLWFKNWVQLQSVRALEHVHVLVRNATPEDLRFWSRERK